MLNLIIGSILVLNSIDDSIAAVNQYQTITTMFGSGLLPSISPMT